MVAWLAGWLLGPVLLQRSQEMLAPPLHLSPTPE